jgi:hypothetical protein
LEQRRKGRSKANPNCYANTGCISNTFSNTKPDTFSNIKPNNFSNTKPDTFSNTKPNSNFYANSDADNN